MYIEYKYTISRKKLVSSAYITIMISVIPIISLYRLIPTTLYGRDFILMILLFIFGLGLLCYVGFDFVDNIFNFRENRNNPRIIVDDESITLPFEDDNKVVIKLYFDNIKKCKESYTLFKKKKEYFIYLSLKAGDEDYRLYKTYMKSSDYQELKSILFKQIKSK